MNPFVREHVNQIKKHNQSVSGRLETHNYLLEDEWNTHYLYRCTECDRLLWLNKDRKSYSYLEVQKFFSRVMSCHDTIIKNIIE